MEYGWIKMSGQVLMEFVQFILLEQVMLLLQLKICCKLVIIAVAMVEVLQLLEMDILLHLIHVI